MNGPTTGATAGRVTEDRRGGRIAKLLADPWSRWVAVAVVLGLAVRVAWVIYATRQPLGLYDAARYFGYAQKIARGKGYTEGLTGQATTYYPPGYPWFLGIVNTVLRHSPLSDDLPLMGGLVQAVLGAASVLFVSVVARRVVSPVAGIIAAFVMALYPNLVFHTAALLSETLYNFLFLGFVAVLLRRPWREGLPPRRIAAAALLLGLAILVRPISLAVVPVLALAWWLHARDHRTVLRWTAIAVAVVVACIVPWTVRNALRMHALVPISTNTGDNLCIGHRPGANGSFTFDEVCNTGEGVQNGTEAEVRRDRTKTRLALRFIRQDPGRELYLTGQRLIIMFERDDDAVNAVQSYGLDDFIRPGAERWLQRVCNGAWLIVGVVGLIGLGRLLWRRRPEGVLVVLCAVATATVPLLFFGDPRFKVPVVPLLIIAGACAVVPRWPHTPSPAEP